MRGNGLVLALLLTACGAQQASDTRADVTAIEAQMHARFDRADAKLDAGPVVVSGDHAVADWTQGPIGGRALFERREGKWALVLCGEDALRDVAYLKQAGVPAADAEALAASLAQAEKAVTHERLAKMHSFNGTVTADQMPARS